MKKLKLYLDTSVISHLEAPDRPDWMADTRRFWEDIQAGMYEVFISPVVTSELANCAEPKKTVLNKWLGTVEYTMLRYNDEVEELALLYSKSGILPQKSERDRFHIAYACVYDCDIIISWNFKHLIKYRTITDVKSVNASAGYREISIYSPTMMIEEEFNDDT